jgi:secreted trypsin-like serine protease
VDRNIILTAAHCADSFISSSQMFALFTAQPECDIENRTIALVARVVESVIVNPQWNKNSTDIFRERGDLALLRISDKAPYAWDTTSLSKSYIDPAGRPTLVAGYGSTTEHDADDGIPMMLRATFLQPLALTTKIQAIQSLKRMAAADATVTSDQFQKIDFMFDAGPDREMIFFDQTQGRGVCSGDSGGASFSKHDGKIFATGIASYVSNPSHLNQACHMIGAHTSVLFYRQWLESSFQSLRNFYSTKTTLFE